jgi:hypothetical protein
MLEFRRKLEDSLETLFRTIFFWAQSEQDLGLWISYFHIGLAVCIGAFVLTYRLFRPPFWAVLGMTVFVACLFLQHVFLRACVLSRIEKRLLGEGAWFMRPFLGLFGIPATRKTVLGITIMFFGVLFAVLMSEVAGELVRSF